MKSLQRLVTCAICLLVMTSSIPARAGKFIWTDEGSIYRANIDGTNLEQIYAGSNSTGFVFNLDLDIQNGVLYSIGGIPSSPTEPFIRQSLVNGQDLTDVITSGLGPHAYGLAVDPVNQDLYAGQHIPGGPGSGIQFLNTDGTGLGKLPATVYYPHQIEVDPLNNKLYFGDVVGFNGIRRSNLDGTGVQVLAPGIVVGEALDIDVPNNKLYYSHNEGSLGPNSYQIWSSDLDGSNKQLLLNVAERTNDIEIWNGKLYWTNQFGIWTSNLDGSNPQKSVSFDAGNPWGADGFAIFSAPQQETSHTDAPLTRIGTSSTLPPKISIANNGDGNLSGLGAASNLNGSVDTGTDGRFVGGGTSISLPDHTSTSVPITYTPTTHSVDTSTFTVDYSNGSADGTNQAESVQVEVSGQGVGPTYESNPAPGSTIDFGPVVIGTSSTLPLDITNSSTDPNGGDSTLTDLTLLSAVIAGPDAAEFTLLGFTPGTVLHQQDLINLLIEFSPQFGPGSKDATITLLTDEGTAFGSPGLSFTYSLQGAATPEPASLLGFAVVGSVGVLMWRRRHASL